MSTDRGGEASRPRFSYDLIPAGSRVLCALSGGADSMYLLCRLAEGAEQGGYTVCAAHYNHRLRESADRDESFVRSWCRARGIPLEVGSGDVAGESARQGLGIEACARQMRYAFLEEAARRGGCGLIATGHHADDNGETILMNLIRGCGLNGLSGIPARRGRIIRPMLAITREEILGELARRGVPHVEDESNSDQAYTRNRIRSQVMPLLSQINPQAVLHLSQCACRAAEDEAELSRQGAALAGQAALEAGEWVLPAQLLAQAPRPIALRAVRQLMRQAGGDGDSAHPERVLSLVGETGREAALEAPGCTVCLAYGRLYVIPRDGGTAQEAMPLTQGEHRWNGWRITCRRSVCPEQAQQGDAWYLRPGDYTVRERQTGDVLRLPKRPAKTVKKLMIEQKIPAHIRGRTPVAVCAGEVAAVGGLGPSASALARPGEDCLVITMKRGE